MFDIVCREEGWGWSNLTCGGCDTTCTLEPSTFHGETAPIANLLCEREHASTQCASQLQRVMSPLVQLKKTEMRSGG